MGMDLKPMKPSKDAPRYPEYPHDVIWGRYNWSGWRFITDLLEQWGVPMDEFAGSNDGQLIKAKTCRLVADAIEKHIDELDKEDQEWLRPHIARWRTCGGYRQY